MAESKVGFIGLGAMGTGLAHNLQKHLKSKGSCLLVNNRTKDKPEVEQRLSEGAKWVESPTALAGECDIVFSMLSADAALESVFSDYLSGKPRKGSIYVDCSTVFPDMAEKLEARASSAGIAYLACPVIGRPDATLAGKALIISSGEQAAKEKVRPYLDALGRGVMDVGDSARLGNSMKLVANFFIMGMTELIAEGMTLADKSKVERESVVTFLRESFQGPITGGYAERAAKDAFKITAEEPGFSARGGLKDATHIQNLAKALGVPMPVVDVVVENLTELNRRGGGDSLDWGSSALLVRERAGIKEGHNLLR